MRLVASDGYFGCDLFCGFGFRWVRILVWCSNGGFGGLVWCFNSVSEVMVFCCCCCLVGLVFLGGLFSGASVSMSLVVEERDKDEEMGDKSIVFYSICFVVYIILLGCM